MQVEYASAKQAEESDETARPHHQYALSADQNLMNKKPIFSVSKGPPESIGSAADRVKLSQIENAIDALLA